MSARQTSSTPPTRPHQRQQQQQTPAGKATASPSKLLWQAAAAGDLPGVKALLARGMSADLLEPSKQGASPLHAAAARGHLDVVDALLGAGAQVDLQSKQGYTPLHAGALLIKPKVHNTHLTPLCCSLPNPSHT